MIRSHLRAAACRETPHVSASITVFASLSLLLVASFLLTLLEAARVQGLRAYAQMNRVNAMETVFSEYHRNLFDEYDIFLLDGGYGSGALNPGMINSRLQAVSQRNLRPATKTMSFTDYQNFYQMDVPECSVVEYLLATDDNGAPFRAMAAESMKAVYPLEIAQQLYEQFQTADHTMNQARQSQDLMEQAQNSLETAKKEQQAAAAAAQGASGTQTQTAASTAPAENTTEISLAAPAENPIETIQNLKKKDLLTVVLPPGKTVSSKKISAADQLENRSLQTGNMSWNRTDGWYEAVLYQQFLRKHFQCFTTGSGEEKALEYELEYILMGKASDRDNLKAVVTELLLLREGANYLYLLTDTVKREEALAVASALAAAVGLMPMVGVIEQGILAAWAYGESVLDVRTLMAGGKIPWMKTAESWRSSLSGLGALSLTAGESVTNGNGSDYQDYIQKLLYLKSKRALNYRAMDLMEQGQHIKPGCEKLQMDSMVLALKADMNYEAAPLFSTMVTLHDFGTKKWEFHASETYSYLPDKQNKK